MKQKKKKGGGWSDHYTRQAKKEKYPARSVYKLQEIQKKFNVIRKGDRVFDLGCAPGSWLLYASELTGSKGYVRGIDIKPVTLNVPANVHVETGDIYELTAGGEAPFNVVISDMAPATTGRKDLDAARSFELCRAALDVAEKLLAPDGNFVCKIFQGDDFKEFTESIKKNFKQYKIFKPQSCRKASKEIFVIGMGKKAGG